MSSYADAANLAADGEFSQRISACIIQEARVKGIVDKLANEIMRNTATGTGMFLPFVTSHQDIIDFYADPGGGGQQNVPDISILGAVQADWTAVTAVHGLV
jgi:hypothetical protein